MKIVITDAGTVFDRYVSSDVFSEFGEVVSHHLLKYDELAENIKDADIVLCNKSLMNEGSIKNAEKLKYIGLFATGYNNIDTVYTRERGITVCNAGSYSTDAVAQHTFALMLSFFSRVSEYSNFVNNGGWKRSETFSPFICTHNELYGKTLGIIGYGSIGKKVAAIASAFGMRVLCYTRTVRNEPGAEFVSFETLLRESDVVSAHCPLNDKSLKMFGREQFKMMKKTAVFINTARGGVVDEAALREALDTGEIAGAGIDVLTTEPMEDECLLFGAPNCILTPHVAWAPVETRQRLISIVSDNIRAWLNGNPINVVN
ncbi:MAG: D-2-hydroxyacid dehydrogenase [Clostridia bacterium]|nr:D-2-hydroxyacid dehydrogenase [Clostridia bacterium]